MLPRSFVSSFIFILLITTLLPSLGNEVAAFLTPSLTRKSSLRSRNVGILFEERLSKPRPKTTTSSVPLQLSKDDEVATTNPTSKASIPSRSSYNDDAFGLVFLGAFLAVKDFAFAGTFLVFSAIAATSTKLGYVKNDSRVPGAVAALALVVSPFVNYLLIPDCDALQLPPPVEIAVCVVSVGWAFFNWQKSGI